MHYLLQGQVDERKRAGTEDNSHILVQIQGVSQICKRPADRKGGKHNKKVLIQTEQEKPERPEAVYQIGELYR